MIIISGIRLGQALQVSLVQRACYERKGVAMSEDAQPKPVKTNPLMRRVLIYAVLVLVVFLFGFVPAWLQSRECSSSLSEAERQLGLVRIENALASATIDARRGDYERARQASSIFFTSLRAETDKGADSALSPAQRD